MKTFIKIFVIALMSMMPLAALAQNVVIMPTSDTSLGLAPAVTAALGNNLVVKATGGNLYFAYATNETATAGKLMVFDATAAPADGAVTPKACVTLPASGTGSVTWAPSPPAKFVTGITVVVSSNASCFTKTTGVITAFISGTAP